jgi:hypothetical protein
MVYNGIPNKRRRVYADQEGHLLPLDKRSGRDHWFSVASSGTLVADGHLTVTGTEFKSDSVITATYRGTTTGTDPLYVVVRDGVATFTGENDAAFYYVVVNFLA